MQIGVCFLCAAAAVGLQASGQEELVVSVSEVSVGSWEIHATLNNPTGIVEAVMSDCSFHIEGAAFSSFNYNPTFESDFFGLPSFVVTPTTIDFMGLSPGGPLADPGGPDPSNPLFIASFDSTSVDDFDLTGQNSGYYESGGKFPIVFFYQDVFGNPGTVPFRIEINPIPAPGVPVVMGIIGTSFSRRRR